MIVTITFNPAVDITLKGDNLKFNGLNRVKKLSKDAGGKGINVSKTLMKLGINSLATGFIGGSNGKYIYDEVSKYGINSEFIVINQETRMNIKLLDENNNLTEFNQQGPIVCDTDINKLKTLVLEKTKKEDIVILSGKVNPNVDSKIYADIIEQLKSKGVKVVLDTERDLLINGIKAKPLVIKPNKQEICEILEVDNDINDLLLIKKCKEMLNNDLQLIVLTLGNEGAYYITSNAVYKVPIINVEAKSCVGAGDATVAGIAFAIEKKYELEELIAIATACAAGAVMSDGTNPANIEVINDLKTKVNFEKVIL